MPANARLLLLLLSATGVVSGQGSRDAVLAALRRGDHGDAAGRLAALLRAPAERGEALRWAERAFRDAGASAAWLEALGTVLREDPVAGEVRLARAHTLLDLKLLRRARADFLELERQGSSREAVREGLLWVAVIGFEHEEAAERARGSEPAVARYQGHLAASLARGASRQLGALFGAAALVAAVSLFLRRRMRRGPHR